MQASARIDELKQKFHENPRRYFAPLANEYRKAGDPEQAIAICRAHLAQQPGHMSGHVVYGRALYDAQRTDEARTVFEKALSLDPDNAIVLKHMGDIARQRGDSTEAKNWYGRALDADPQDTEVAAYIAELAEPLTEAEESTPSSAAGGTAEPGSGESAEPPADLIVEPVLEEPAGPATVEGAEDSAEVADPDAGVIEEALPEAEPVETEPPEPQPADLQPPSVPEIETSMPTGLSTEFEVADDAFTPKEEPQEIDWDAELVDDSFPGSQYGYETDPLQEALPEIDWAAEMRTPADEQGSIETPLEATLESGFGDQSEVGETVLPDEDTGLLAPSIVDEATESVAAESTPAQAEPTEAVSTEAVSPEPVSPEPAAPDAAVPWRKTPAHEDSPFVTRTMAELYLKQGYRLAALDVYRQLALSNPDDSDIRNRVAELSGDEPPRTDTASPEEEPPPAATTPAQEVPAAELQETSAPAQFNPSETIASVDPELLPAHASDMASFDDADESHFNSSVVYAPSNEDLDLVADASAETGTAGSETQPVDVSGARIADGNVADGNVAAGDPWDTDVWAAGFSSDDTSSLEIEAPDNVDDGAVPPASGEEAEPAFVAYSPQPPRPDDLAHYTPKGPTVREFFATLGARRAPEANREQAYTARAAIPAVDVDSSQTPAHEEPTYEEPTYEEPAYEGPQEEYAEADDPFDYGSGEAAEEHADNNRQGDSLGELFSDSSISEEDTRAAFALSGAMSGTPMPLPEPPVPVEPSGVSPAPQSFAETTQESAEDIRRFREWLDGLADS